MRRTEPSTLGDIVTQLRITNRLLVAQMKASGQAKQQDLVALLETSGASAREIAEILDTTPATIQATLQRLRKRRGGNGGRSEKGS